MNLSSVWSIPIWSVITKLIDICVVWCMAYYILKNAKNNVKMLLIVKGVIIVLAVKILSDLLNLYTVGYILTYVFDWGPIAVIILFQPEIRGFLESIGRTKLLGRHKILTVEERERVVYEIMDAIDYLRKNKIGALIVIERDVSLQEYIAPATKVYADLTSPLLGTIFFPNSPLHDGGVIIQGDRITCAGAVFKTSMDPNLNKKLGTRHRAALGIAEESDAVALIVSEETGKISIAVDHEIHYNLSLDEFRMMLVEELKPKTEIFYDADGAESEGETNEK